MTLFSLAKKNIKGNFRNYVVYFISLVFSMVIYFTFVSLQYSDKIQESILLSETMDFMFMASSAVLILFVGIFILYSNSFFTRQRKKEVGLYSMLGLRKKTIGKMLFYENLIMGVIALIIGIVLGAVLSQLFSMILIKLMGSAAVVDFSISIAAIVQTAAVFMVIILFTSVQSYRLIYRFKLIELFHAQKKGEQAPQVSAVSTVTGLVMLGISYYLILRPFPGELTNEYVQFNYGSALILLIIGTHLFFRSVTLFILKGFQKIKARYFRGINLLVTSQLLYRIRGNARTFTLIAILSAATISFFGATYSGYYGSEQRAKDDVPFTYTHLSRGNEFDQQAEDLIKKDSEHPVLAEVTIPIITVSGELSFKLDYVTEPIKLLSETTFNQVSEALNRDKKVSLFGNEAAIIKPRLTEFKAEQFIGESIMLENQQTLSITDLATGSILPFDYPDFFVVVSDEVFAEVAKEITPLTYQAYEVEDEKTTEATAIAFDQLAGKDFQVTSSFYIAYKEGKEGNALSLFILGFLGLVFLAATGSIIYFKQLTEANEVKPNYDILRKVGLSKKEVRKTIQKQSRFVFGLPLTVGILHGSAILHFTSNFISNLIGASMLIPFITAMASFILIYLIYYVLTVNTYHNIVNK